MENDKNENKSLVKIITSREVCQPLLIFLVGLGIILASDVLRKHLGDMASMICMIAGTVLCMSSANRAREEIAKKINGQ